MQGRVEDIFIAESGGAPMKRVAEIMAIADAGLEGDRYMQHTGYWSATDECQVTLIEKEALELIDRETNLHACNGEHRRNIVVAGLSLAEIVHCRFSIGEAVFEYDRPRPPCSYIQSITQPGMTRALSGGRGGICARVVKSGKIRVHDPICVLKDSSVPSTE
ncbi:MAG: MOSC domain-containing protein [Acidobacteria bacterium]|nr:MOSC domain-containing protein [Acidobacteriota bacterium]